MAVERIAGGLLAVSFVVWAALPSTALAGQIVGITFGRTLYNVDSLTGNTTLLNNFCSSCGPYVGASGSPDANTILIYSIVNLHEINVENVFQDTPLGGITRNPVDLAFDRDTNTVFDTNGSALFSVHCPSPPFICTETQVGPAFPTNHMQALGWVAGAGLYGVSDNFLYFINDLTGVTTPIGATGLTDPTKPITDIAYDVGTGRLIASAGCSKFDPFGPQATGPCDESHQGSLYLIDRSTGHATLLNGNAPMIVGLAEVVPEPGSALLLAGSVGAFLLRSWWRQTARWRRSGWRPFTTVSQQLLHRMPAGALAHRS